MARQFLNVMRNMRSFICVTGLIVISNALWAGDALVRVHPESEKPYVVITASKKVLNEGDKVKITVFLVNPTKEDIKIRCSDLFGEDGAPIDGFVSYQFREEGVAEMYAVPRGRRSSYVKFGNRTYDVIKANSHISDSFEWVCDQSKTGAYTFSFSFNRSPFPEGSSIAFLLNQPKDK